MSFTIKTDSDPSPEEVLILANGIAAYATQMKGMNTIKLFASFIRDDENHILGGCSFYNFYGCLYVDQLWVADEIRGNGYGRQLMIIAEKFGKEQGCTFAAVNTMDWEALQFYKKLGYDIEFERKGFANNSILFFLRKVFV